MPRSARVPVPSENGLFFGECGTRAACTAFCFPTGNLRRAAMPVILLWAVPAIFVVGGLTYVVLK